MNELDKPIKMNQMKLKICLLFIMSNIKIVLLRITHFKRFCISFKSIIGKRNTITGKGIIKIKKGLVIRNNCWLESNGELCIGKGCFINNNVSITAMKKIEIGNNVSIANNVVIIDHDHDYRGESEGRFISSNIIIGDDVWIGANVVILRGTSIGNHCVIGAGSIVKCDVPPSVMYLQKRNTSFRELTT